MANISDKKMKDLMKRYVKLHPDEVRKLDKDIAKFEKSRSSKKASGKKLIKKSVKAYKELGQRLSRRAVEQSVEYKKFERKYAPPKAKTAIKVLKPAKKSIARKIAGKVVGKAIPVAGAAIIAKDVIKGASKATCSKRGGKWVSGKCVGTTKSIFGKKHTKFKKGATARDPISKR